MRCTFSHKPHKGTGTLGGNLQCACSRQTGFVRYCCNKGNPGGL